MDMSGAQAESPEDQAERVKREMPLAANARLFIEKPLRFDKPVNKAPNKKWWQWWK